jgi:hypothetical protein
MPIVVLWVTAEIEVSGQIISVPMNVYGGVVMKSRETYPKRNHGRRKETFIAIAQAVGFGGRKNSSTFPRCCGTWI